MCLMLFFSLLQVYTIKVFDVTMSHKSGEKTAEHLQEAINIVEQQ